MIRIFFLYILPLILPTVIYFVWIRLKLRKNPYTSYKIIPLPLLLITGLILIAILLSFFVTTNSYPEKYIYERARYRTEVNERGESILIIDPARFKAKESEENISK